MTTIGARRRVEVRPFGPDEADAVAAYTALTNAWRAVDTPWQRPATVASTDGELRHGWDGEPPEAFLAWDGDVPVGGAELFASEWDNRHLVWVWLGVHPGHRRRGVGTTLLAAVEERTRELGRSVLGVFGWDSEASRGFAAAHGLELRAQDVCRRQTLAEVDPDRLAALHAEAARRAAAYELVRRTGRTPDDELAALARLTEAINDAPTDDLDMDDEVFPPERVRAYETAQTARAGTIHRVLARHRETGELAGHTVVVVDGHRPGLAGQHDTAVAREHRGHRLGLLLKADMLLWLREAEPQLREIDTGNAETNAHMIAVNEQLGYRVMGRFLFFQRGVRPPA
jgi:GNAT superfamily N-acetyltransferase